jgi:hypothetical protein
VHHRAPGADTTLTVTIFTLAKELLDRSLLQKYPPVLRPDETSCGRPVHYRTIDDEAAAVAEVSETTSDGP